MRRVLLTLLILLFSSFTNVKFTNILANSTDKSITTFCINDIKSVKEQTVAEEFLLKNYGIVTDNIPNNMPVDSIGFKRITDTYGFRKVHPVLHKASFHRGIDFAGKYGTQIYPAATGQITKIDYSGSYGKYIIVDHGNNLTTLYAHLSKVTVQLGDTVDITTVLGKLGSSGWSTGPHLHFEIRINDTAINPTKLLDKAKVPTDDISKIMLSNRLKSIQYGTERLSGRKFYLQQNTSHSRNFVTARPFR